MWEFLGDVLNKSGVVAALFFFNMIVFVGAIVGMWRWMIAVLKKHATDANQHRKEIVELQVKHAKDVADLTMRIDALQDRRLNEMMKLTREVVDHVAETKSGFRRVAETMEVLKQIMSGRR